MSPEENVKLVMADEKEFSLQYKYIKDHSSILEYIIKDKGIEHPIKLLNIKGETFDIIKSWLESLTNNNQSPNLPNKLDIQALIDLMQAAKFLDIDLLIQASAIKFAYYFLKIDKEKEIYNIYSKLELPKDLLLIIKNKILDIFAKSDQEKLRSMSKLLKIENNSINLFQFWIIFKIINKIDSNYYVSLSLFENFLLGILPPECNKLLEKENILTETISWKSAFMRRLVTLKSKEAYHIELETADGYLWISLGKRLNNLLKDKVKLSPFISKIEGEIKIYPITYYNQNLSKENSQIDNELKEINIWINKIANTSTFIQDINDKNFDDKIKDYLNYFNKYGKKILTDFKHSPVHNPTHIYDFFKKVYDFLNSEYIKSENAIIFYEKNLSGHSLKNIFYISGKISEHINDRRNDPNAKLHISTDIFKHLKFDFYGKKAVNNILLSLNENNCAFDKVLEKLGNIRRQLEDWESDYNDFGKLEKERLFENVGEFNDWKNYLFYMKNNNQFNGGKIARITHDTDKIFSGNLLHGYFIIENKYPVFYHSDKSMYGNTEINELFTSIPQCKTLTELKNKIASICFRMAKSSTYCRGQAAITEWIMHGIAAYFGYEISWKKWTEESGLSPDIYAMNFFDEKLFQQIFSNRIVMKKRSKK
jgi:hypothetical protein